MENKIFIKKLSKEAKIPTRGSNESAGMDIYSIEDVVINPLERKIISTGISIKIPSGYYGRVAPRSGLALKNGIDTMAGVIDSDYRGEVKTILYNTDKDNPFEIRKNDRIAQIIIEKIMIDYEIKEVNDLDNTDRGHGGFGSTGR